MEITNTLNCSKTIDVITFVTKINEVNAAIQKKYGCIAHIIATNIYIINQIFICSVYYNHEDRKLGSLNIFIDNKLDDNIYFYLDNQIVGKILISNLNDNGYECIYKLENTIDEIQILEF